MSLKEFQAWSLYFADRAEDGDEVETMGAEPVIDPNRMTAAQLTAAFQPRQVRRA